MKDPARHGERRDLCLRTWILVSTGTSRGSACRSTRRTAWARDHCISHTSRSRTGKNRSLRHHRSSHRRSTTGTCRSASCPACSRRCRWHRDL